MNPTHVRNMNKKAFFKRKQNNPEHVRELERQAFIRKKKENPNHIKKINNNVQKRKRDQSRQLQRDEHELLETPRKKQNCAVAEESQEIKMEKVIQSFHDSIKFGPEYICSCCDQLWYRSSVTKCDANKYTKCTKNLLNVCITGKTSVDNNEWICLTCHSNLSNGKLPVCSKGNKMGFPVKPECLNLTPLEERLISPRIPFMQIRELPRGGQLSIHGNVVNVPADVNSIVYTLPRPINESQTIPIKLKRKLSYKHHYQFQNVRPGKVLEAAKHLVKTSELFQNENIDVQDNWLDNINSAPINEHDEWEEFVNSSNINQINVPSSKKHREEPANKTDKLNSESKNDGDDDDDDDDVWCEVEERPSGVTDTLLQEPDISENVEKIINFAPGEGNKPLGIFMDKQSEFLSFPTIYCGKTRVDNKERTTPVHYSTVCKWQLRSQDRKVAQSVPNIFYKLKKLQIQQIQNTASISLRKCKTKGKKYTAGDLKSHDYVNKLIQLDEGFRVLRNLRGSPPYFEKCKKDLFAMIRQLGNPTWFC